MKDLGCAKKILGINIIKFIEKRRLFLSQDGYWENVIKWFNMINNKLITTLIPSHFKLLASNSPSMKEEKRNRKGTICKCSG